MTRLYGRPFKVVVGVDGSVESVHACELLAALDLKPRLSVELVHVVEAIQPAGYGTLPPDTSWMVEMEEAAAQEGRVALERARHRLVERGVADVQVVQRHGYPAHELLAHAESVGAKLLAIGAADLSAWRRLTLGSVSRRILAASTCSVLIAKGSPLPKLPLRAVFATDHSTYARRCAALLAQLSPGGIGQLLVLTSFPRTLVAKIAASKPHFKADVAAWLEERLYDENHTLAAQLGSVTGRVEVQVAHEAPVDAIRKALDGWDADLLVVGAHGHGMLERLVVGSVSAELAAHDPRHTLILRPE